MNQNLSKQDRAMPCAARALSLAVALAFQPALALAAPPALPANALPSGAQVAAGQAQISQQGANLLVQQHSQKLITNWQSFNIGSGAGVQFLQPNAQSVALNRVVAGDASQILGQLRGNGQVFLVNPQGVVFGQGARVDVGGLVVSSLGIKDQDFLNGQYRFGAEGAAGGITNAGEIKGRYIVLLAPSVDNRGQIQAAEGGQLALLAGGGARLQLDAGGLVSVQLDASATEATIRNSGALIADGGRVLLSAQSAAPGLAAAINQSGTVRANSLSERNGEIWLDGGRGSVELSGQTLAQGQAGGLTGGKIVATADTLKISGRVDASGQAGGGTVLLGGGVQGKDATVREARSVLLEAGSQVTADGGSGRGGTVVAWSGEHTVTRGALSARGEAGGGFIETSSRGRMDVGGSVITGAGGTWLTDPTDFVLDSSNKATYEGFLNTGGTVNIDADNSITIKDDLAKTSGPDATLNFRSNGSIVQDAGKSISSQTGKLNISFWGSLANESNYVGGSVLLGGSLSSNGGSVNFYKPTTLASTAPVSTKLLGVSSGAAGNITFHRDVTLASPTLAVNLSTQGAQSGSTYVGTGGAIEFKGKIESGVVGSIGSLVPQGLTLDSTGTVPGAITLRDSVGSVAKPLARLTLTGPMQIALEAAEINLRATSGDVLTASSTLGTPTLVLGAANTDIRVTGGTVNGITGYADYKQETFHIGVKDASARGLTITADRSIKIKNSQIDGVTNAGGNKLDVRLNAYQADAAGGGAIHLNNAQIRSNGGLVALGGSGTAAAGAAVGTSADPDGNTDGIQIFNSQIATAGGALSLAARAPDSLAAGAGIHVFGLSTLDSGSGAMSLNAAVKNASTAGNKDAVVIGEGSSSQVSLLASGGGTISIQGDASAVGNVTSGSRYNGVIISQGALVQTDAGKITVQGKGGGGNDFVSDQNHGVRLDTAKTRLLSSSGDISIGGVSGGKVGSVGIFSAGNEIYLGRMGAGSNTGHIELVADSMFLSNSSATRLQAASGGELRLRSWSDNRNISLGATDINDLNGALALGSTWFSGANAVFQPGFANITIGEAGMSPVASRGQLSVDGATTVRDHLNLAMQGAGGKVQLNAALSVQGAGASGTERTLSLRVADGARSSETGLLSVDKLHLIGAGEFKLIAPNLINTVAGTGLNGAVTLKNAQALLVGAVGSTSRGVASGPAQGLSTTAGQDISLTTSAGHLRQERNIEAGSGAVSLTAQAGSVLQSGSAIVRADRLAVASQTSSSLLNANEVRGLAAQLSGTEANLSLRSTGALNLESVAGLNGVIVPGTLWLQAEGGALTQSQAVAARSAALQAAGDIVLTQRNAAGAANRIGTLAARTGNGDLKLLNAIGMTVGAAGTADAGATLAGIDVGQRGVRVEASSGNLVLANSIKAGSNATVSLQASQGAINQLGSAGATESRAPIITAGALLLSAVDSASLMNENEVGRLAAEVGGSAKDLSFVGRRGVLFDAVSDIEGRTLRGLNVSGKAWVEAREGDIRQTEAVKADALGLKASGEIALALNQGGVAANQIANLAARAGTGSIHVVSRSAMQVSAVGTAASQAVNGQALVGVATNDRDITLRSTQGELVLGQSVSAGKAVLSLEAAQGVRQLGGAIQADGLRVLAGGAIDLQQAQNQVRVLAASGQGPLAYRDADGLEIGAVTVSLGQQAGRSAGLNSGQGEQLVQSGDALLLSQDVRAGSGLVSLEAAVGGIRQSGGSLQADKLRLLAGGQGDVALQQAGNRFGQVAARVAGGSLALQTQGALNVTSLARSLGANSAERNLDGLDTAAGNGAQSLKSGGALQLAQQLKAGQGSIALDVADGGVRQSGGAITAAALRIQAGGVGAVDLQQAGNQVQRFAAAVAEGTLAYNNAGALTLEALSTRDREQLVRAGGAIALSDTLRAGAATVSLEAQGGIQQSGGSLDADALRLLAAGDVSLQQQGNRIGRVAAQTGDGALALHSQSALKVGSVRRELGGEDKHRSLAGISTGNRQQTLSSAGAIELAADLKGSQIALVSAQGGIRQTAGSLQATSLEARSTGSAAEVALRQAGNSVARFAAQSAGGVALENQGSLVIGQVGASRGIAAQGEVFVRSSADLSLEAGQVSSASGSRQAVVLAAGQAFRNQAGADAVAAPSGRWLIYDDNPFLDLSRLGGLKLGFLQTGTVYAALPPDQVQQPGSGYITTGVPPLPEQFARLVGGAAGNENSGNLATHAQGSRVARAGLKPALWQRDGQTGEGGEAPREAQALSLAGADWRVALRPGERFVSPLQDLLGTPADAAGEAEAARLADGGALPAWLSYDAASRQFAGLVPPDLAKPIRVKVMLRSAPGAAPRAFELDFVPQSR